jgi:hypothetical protein
MTHMTRYGDPRFSLSIDENMTIGVIWGVFVCDQCDSLSIAVLGYKDTYKPDATVMGKLLDDSESMLWIPAKAVGKNFPNVPDQIAQAADEAHRCLSIKAYRGAVMLARAVVEAIAKDKGITGRNLQVRIDGMVAAQLIPARTGDAAHEVRHFGNDMAHGDFIENVPEEEAELTLTLMGEVLNEVYQAPARIAAAQAARTARKATQDSAKGSNGAPR